MALTMKQLEARIAKLEQELERVDRQSSCSHRWTSRGPFYVCEVCDAKRKD